MTCADHEPRLSLYLASHLDAIKRLKRGEKQVKCPECGLWVWMKKPEGK